MREDPTDPSSSSTTVGPRKKERSGRPPEEERKSVLKSIERLIGAPPRVVLPDEHADGVPNPVLKPGKPGSKKGPGAVLKAHDLDIGRDVALKVLRDDRIENREEALGGTNLFGALQLAFDDPIVDTFYVLSDGDPAVGLYTDPSTILEVVEGWNRHRGVKVHCVAVGGPLETLERLASQSGGKYVRIP